MQNVSTADIHSTFADVQLPRVEPKGKYLAFLSLAALGVVYGDIGTSPLYAIRECFHCTHAIAPTPPNVLGLLSIIFWSLVLVICVKNLTIVLRADKRGEVGIKSLASLTTPIKPSGRTEK
jgi:KUP system potassium uptake protein